jgi:hypothetical protein
MKGQQTMDFAPISGIRAVSLLNVQKAPDKVAPRFEIEASERTRDESRSTKQESADRGLDAEDEVPEQAEIENEAEPAESPSDGSFDWFV